LKQSFNLSSQASIILQFFVTTEYHDNTKHGSQNRSLKNYQFNRLCGPELPGQGMAGTLSGLTWCCKYAISIKDVTV
jgi:hypothetical protein